MKSRKRPRNWHRSVRSSRVFYRLQSSLPSTGVAPDRWGEPVQLHRKSQRPKKKSAS